MNKLKPDRRKSKPNFKNPRCYARALGGCCIEMSGEHPLSRALLERVDQELGELSTHVEIRNLAFQERGVAEHLGIGKLESKILCAHHNSGLSLYDAEVVKAFDAFEKLHYAAADRDVVTQPVYTIDGDRLERFLLKALCGCLYAGLFPVEECDRMKDVEPPLGWLETLYRGEPFPPGHGLYWKPPASGEPITADRTIVKCSPLLLVTEDYVSIHGLRFWLFGFEFTLLAPGPEERAVEALGRQAYRPAGLTIDGTRTRVSFAWKDGAGSREIEARFV
jgi:hypothetical protein